MIKAIIIDHEIGNREVLANLITENCSRVEVMDSCNGLEDGIKSIANHKPELIFFNLDTPGPYGLELFLYHRTINFDAIFTTSNHKTVLTGNHLNMVDFLSIPVDKDDFLVAILRAEKRILKKRFYQQSDNILQNIRYLNEDKKIALPTQKGFELICIKDIIRCEGDNNYTIFHISGKNKIMVSKTLREYEEMLSDFHFLRVHQSHLVNLRYIKHYDRGDGGWLTLEDNTVIDVARKRKDELIKRLTTLF